MEGEDSTRRAAEHRVNCKLTMNTGEKNIYQKRMYFSSTELLIDAVEPYHPHQAMQTVSFPPHVPTVEDAGALGCAGAAAGAAEPSQPCRFKISGGFLWLLLQSMRVKVWQRRDCSPLDLGELKEKHAKAFLMLINPPRMRLPY